MFLLASENGKYGEIAVYEANQLYGELGKYRFLQFADDAVQGAVDLKDPRRIVLEYPRAIIHLMEAGNPGFGDVFVIGHGVGTIAGHYTDKRFRVAEIDGKVLEMSRRYFGYRADNVVIGDGRRLLADEPSGAYDYIVLDAFSSKGTPLHLNTAEFFEMACSKLKPHGAFIMNLMGKMRNDKRTAAVHSTLASVYSHTKAFVLPAADEGGKRNMIMIGSEKPIGYQLRHMAGFVEFEPESGYIIQDGESGFPG